MNLGLLRVCAVAILFGLILSISAQHASAEAPVCQKEAQKIQKLEVFDPPRAVPTDSFMDEKGKEVTLADYKGELVILNHWANWCLPCIREMPSLDRLSVKIQELKGRVIALSSDRFPQETVKMKIEQRGWKNILPYHDKDRGVVKESGAVGLPTTQIINREGLEVARMTGPMEWDGEEVLDYLNCLAK